jgi:hypothetical protein
MGVDAMTERKIIYLDLDAFFCAVEELRDPMLRGRPFCRRRQARKSWCCRFLLLPGATPGRAFCHVDGSGAATLPGADRSACRRATANTQRTHSG